MSIPSRTTSRPTLQQVATAAEVSLKTASRALNEEPNVAPETARRVRDAAERLGFRRNMLAREFRTGARTATVALIIGDVANPFYSRLARGAERRLRAAGIGLTIASTDEDPEREHELVGEMLERRVSGILLVTCSDDHAYVETERRLGTPVVFVDRVPGDVRADAVVLDNADGIAQAVAHLAAAGHRRIALIGDLARLSSQRERRAGFELAMRGAGLASEATVVDGCHDADAASAAVQRLLADPAPPTAVIAGNNRITIGVLSVLRDRESPPTVIGFDDFELADLLGVTVVAHEPETIGEEAAQRVLDRLAGDDSAPTTTIVPTRLVPRG